jgi:hypothetical protein
VTREPPKTAAIAALLMLVGLARSVAQEQAATVGPRPAAAAVRTAEKITVDGRLTEANWMRAVPARDFLQRDPDEGKPATEATEVRFLYDDKAIYIGLRPRRGRAAEQLPGGPRAPGRRPARRIRRAHDAREPGS